MAHAELVARARKWLVARRCRLVVTELVSAISETPDAMGFGPGYRSTLVECKTSRADFLRDRRKFFRNRPSSAMGNYRYYLTPRGLLRPEEVPEGWGLLEVRDGPKRKAVRKVLDAPYHALSPEGANHEKEMLISIAWRALKALELVKPLHLGTVEDEPQVEGKVAIKR